jgi:hypothetical protein
MQLIILGQRSLEVDLLPGDPQNQRLGSPNKYHPYDNKNQVLLASAVLMPQPLANVRIERLVVEKQEPFLQKGTGFKSIQDF